MSSLQNDGRWGPQLEGELDLTLFFEQLMLTILPSSIAVLIIPLYIVTAIRSTRHVRPGFLLWGKLTIGLALVGVQSTNLALWHNETLYRSKLALAAASMSLLASISTLGIIYVAHIYSLLPSSFLSLFLSLTMLFDIVMARSCFRRPVLSNNGALQIATLALKLALISLEEVPKRSLFYEKQNRDSMSREQVAGFWNRATFFWINKLMIAGFREDLTFDSLPEIGEEFDSVRLFDKFSPKWNSIDKASSVALSIALLRTVPRQLAKVILPRLVFVLLNFSQPFLLLRVVQVVSNGGSISGDTAGALVGATALVYFGTMISRALEAHYSYRAITCVRGVLIVSIFDKMQRLEVNQLADSAAVTLMTADTKGVEQIVSITYEFWSSSLQVGLGLWSLSLFVGRACFLMLIPGLCSFAASNFISKSISMARTNWNRDIQTRVAATSTILAQIKNVKATGMSLAVSEYLQEKRQKEIKTSMQDRRARLWMFAFAALNNALTPVIVLGGAYFWTRAENRLSSAEVYTILAIVTVAADPLILILQAIMGWTVAFASLKRIQDFLLSKEFQDVRQNAEPATTTESIAYGSTLHSRASEFAVEMMNVGFTAHLKGTILQEINIRIPWGTLAMIKGPINCGKSSLMRAIIGETPITSGTVKVGSKRIAYCNQEPWIQNQTLRSGIIGPADFVAEVYRAVLFSCDLDADISQMPNGDQTVTGTGGCNLSGGQKQRLSLARAAYTEMDIVVLDDVLSALDTQTARTIMGRLFGPDGLFRRRCSTVIMTTNRVEFEEFADFVYQMDASGHAKLKTRNAVKTEVPARIAGTTSASPECEKIQDEQSLTPLTKAELPSVKCAPTKIALQNARTSRRAGDWSLYAYYLLPAGIFWVASWVVVMAISALVEKMSLIYVRIWYGQDPTNQLYFIGLVCFGVASIVCNTLMGMHFFFKIVPKSAAKLHLNVLNTVLFAKLDFLAHADLGFLLSRFSQDMTFVAQDLPIHFIQFTFIFYLVVIEVGIVAAGTAYVAPIMLVILLALYITQAFYLRTSRQLRLLELEASESLISHVTETSDGIQHLRSFGWVDGFQSQLHDIVNRSQKPYYLLFCVQRWLSLSLDFSSAVAAISLTVLSIYLPEKTSDNAVGLAMLTLISFSTVATYAIRAWTNLETALGAVSRIKGFCVDTPIEENNRSGPAVDNAWPAAGGIVFQGVNANYKAEDGTLRLALDDVNFAIKPGDKVSISGRTGSGKSSIFLVLLHMIDFSGLISVDDRDITSVSLETVRSRCTTLTQDGVELKASVRLNIYPFQGPKPMESDIISTLEFVSLWQHVQRQGGLDADVVEMCFSPSQRQLFFVARSILHQRTSNTSVVLIDEATSAMTQEADSAIQKLMDEAFTGCTVLQIAHHPDWLTTVNVKIHMELGKVASFRRLQLNGDWKDSL